MLYFEQKPLILLKMWNKSSYRKGPVSQIPWPLLNPDKLAKTLRYTNLRCEGQCSYQQTEEDDTETTVPQLIGELDFDDLNDFSLEEVQKKAFHCFAVWLGMALHDHYFSFMYSFTVSSQGMFLSFT